MQMSKHYAPGKRSRGADAEDHLRKRARKVREEIVEVQGVGVS